MVSHYFHKIASPLATSWLPLLFVTIKGKFTLDLRSCSLGDTGIKILMQNLCRSLDPHSKITGHLDMYIGAGNGITGEGASHIRNFLYKWDERDASVSEC